MRCLNCFEEYDESFGICPHCGCISVEARTEADLLPGTTLVNRYILGASIGNGGFGIIYKAWDTRLKSVVAIKEFFPEKIAVRDKNSGDLIVLENGKEEYQYRLSRFLAEDKITAEFRANKNIVTEYDCFETNNTVYMVMEYLVGSSLSDLMEAGEEFSETEAIEIVSEVSKALSAIHNIGIIHRDVSPDNIFIITDPEFRVILLDFGASKLVNYSSDVTDILLKKGYSSIEQYQNIDNASTASDVYSLAATLYKILTKQNPIDAMQRMDGFELASPKSLNESVSDKVSDAIMKAMELKASERYQTVEEFILALEGTSGKKTRLSRLSSNSNTVVQNVTTSRKINMKLLIGIIVSVLVVIIGVYALFGYPASNCNKEYINNLGIGYSLNSNIPIRVISRSAHEEIYLNFDLITGACGYMIFDSKDNVVASAINVQESNSKKRVVSIKDFTPGVYHVVYRYHGEVVGVIYFRVV